MRSEGALETQSQSSQSSPDERRAAIDSKQAEPWNEWEAEQTLRACPRNRSSRRKEAHACREKHCFAKKLELPYKVAGMFRHVVTLLFHNSAPASESCAITLYSSIREQR